MKLTFGWKLIMPVAILSLGMVVPAFAQSNSDASGSAGGSIKQAGSDTVDAAEDVYNSTVDAAKKVYNSTVDAAVHAYNGTAAPMHDTEITTKVKTALHEDSGIVHSDIHVATTAGVVTLQGRVPSSAMASRAERVTLATAGVRRVDDELVVSPKSATD